VHSIDRVYNTYHCAIHLKRPKGVTCDDEIYWATSVHLRDVYQQIPCYYLLPTTDVRGVLEELLRSFSHTPYILSDQGMLREIVGCADMWKCRYALSWCSVL
jgi:hypothetical protein